MFRTFNNFNEWNKWLHIKHKHISDQILYSQIPNVIIEYNWWYWNADI